MKIDGSAFGRRIASPAAGGGQPANSYDAQIKRLQKERERYVEKLQKVQEETSDPEVAKKLASMYQTAISGIDGRIAQLQQAKIEDAQRKAEKQQVRAEPSRESDESGKAGEASKTNETSKTKETVKPDSAHKTEESRGSYDPFDLQEDEKLFWIDDGEKSWPGKKRTPKYPSVLVDMLV